jgi:hypothetical protein
MKGAAWKEIQQGGKRENEGSGGVTMPTRAGSIPFYNLDTGAEVKS